MHGDNEDNTTDVTAEHDDNTTDATCDNTTKLDSEEASESRADEYVAEIIVDHDVINGGTLHRVR